MDNIFATTNLLDIPDEILEIIFLQLPVHDVQWNVALVCKRFLKISRFPGMVKNFSLTLCNMTCEDEMSQCLIKVNTGDFFEEWKEITPQIHIRKELIRLALTDSQELQETRHISSSC